MSSTTRPRPAANRAVKKPSRSPAASHAEGRVSTFSPEKSGCRRATTDAGRIYIEAVLDLYLSLPGTPLRTSRHDRRLAGALYERGIPVALMRAALLLGVARRTLRSEQAPSLPPIRTLHFFLPLLEEVQQYPPEAGYVEYLAQKLRPFLEAKVHMHSRQPDRG